MTPTDTSLVIVALVLFLSAPSLPSALYKSIFTSYIFPFVLLATLLISMTYSRIGSIALLLSFAALFVEFRKRVIDVTYEKQLESAKPIVPTEIHPAYNEPAEELVIYKPSEEMGTNDFAPVASSINQKAVLPTSRLPVQAEEFLIENGFAEKVY